MNPNMLPLGYTFSPTDEELLNYFLYHKIVENFDPPLVLPVIDLYSQEPSMIWQQFGGIDGRDLHFFTQLKKKKSRIIRKVGSNGGTWSGENKAVKVFSPTNNVLIGTFKRFHYENPKLKVRDEDYSWIMYEYTLDPTSVPKGFVHDSYVLCKIRKRIVKREKRAVSSMQTFACWPPAELCDQIPNRRKLVDSQPAEMCVTTLMESYDQNCNNTEHVNQCMDLVLFHQYHGDAEPTDACPTAQMESHDNNLDDEMFVKEIERELEQSNNMEMGDTQEDSSYGNEWYWSGQQTSS